MNCLNNKSNEIICLCSWINGNLQLRNYQFCYLLSSKSISKLVFNIYNCFPYIILGYLFIILGIIGKFGLQPANLGILGIIDGISLFSTILILILNKYVYLIILGLNIFPPISCGVVAKSICVSLLVLLSLVTIYHGISLNLKNFTLRKFITGSSMINVGLLLIIFINRDLSYIILIFYLLFYVIISLGLFGILLL